MPLLVEPVCNQAMDREATVMSELMYITNADRIRAMMDEELAAMIIRSQKSDPATRWCKDEYGCAGLGKDFDCTDELETSCIARWLQQPVEEE